MTFIDSDFKRIAGVLKQDRTYVSDDIDYHRAVVPDSVIRLDSGQEVDYGTYLYCYPDCELQEVTISGDTKRVFIIEKAGSLR